MKTTEDFILGNISAKGRFRISIIKNPAYLMGYQVEAIFTLSTKTRDKLINQVSSYLEKQDIRPKINKMSGYTVLSITTIEDNLKLRDLINGHISGNQYEDWNKALEIIKEKDHLTPKGFNKILKIKGYKLKGGVVKKMA